MRDNDLTNRGVIINRPAGPSLRGGRTLIVTGLYRSGTSLVATILRHAGIFMGRQISDAVLEALRGIETILLAKAIRFGATTSKAVGSATK